MPTGHDANVLARLAGLGARGRTGSSPDGPRYGLPLVVLIGTYLFSAFGGKQLATEDLWKTLLLLMTVIMVVHRVLARPTVTVQSIYGALSAYRASG